MWRVELCGDSRPRLSCRAQLDCVFPTIIHELRRLIRARSRCAQVFFNIRFASLGVMPAIFQKNHPSGAPAILPIPIRQSAGGFCSPRSHREITIDEQLSRLPKAS
jgi:hypothetical protein